MKKLLAILLISSLALVGCSKEADTNADTINEQVTYVQTEKPANKMFEEKIILPGTLVPKEEGIITAKISGVIENVYADLGDMVSKDDILCEIEPEIYANIYNKAKIGYENMTTTYNRMKELYANEAISKADYEAIESQYHSVKEDYELAKLNLEYSRIKSPIAGMISSKDVLIGQGASTGFELFRVVDISELYVETGITEKEINKIKESQPVNIKTESGEIYKGLVKIIGPVPDSQTGTYPIKVLVENNNNELKAGMFVDIEIIIDTKENAMSINKNAIINEDGIDYVFIVKDGKAHKKEIQIGISDEDNVEVISGIDNNEDVVVVGQNKLRDKSKIEIGE